MFTFDKPFTYCWQWIYCFFRLSSLQSFLVFYVRTLINTVDDIKISVYIYIYMFIFICYTVADVQAYFCHDIKNHSIWRGSKFIPAYDLCSLCTCGKNNQGVDCYKVTCDFPVIIQLFSNFVTITLQYQRLNYNCLRLCINIRIYIYVYKFFFFFLY